MRLQLALNVPDLDAAIDYYQRLFGVTVAKRKPAYANFEIDNPPLKLVLFESDEVDDRLNHLGVEVDSDDAVLGTAEQQRQAGIEVQVAHAEDCCFATQNKAISYAPDGTMWEWYRKLEDTEGFFGEKPAAKPMCC